MRPSEFRAPARTQRRLARHALASLLRGAARWRAALCMLASGSAAFAARAQMPTTSVIRGTVRLPSGKAANGVSVSLLETLEQSGTDSSGSFALRSAYRGIATVVAKRVGFVPATMDLLLPVDTAIALVIVPMPPSLGVMTVIAAGEYTLGTGRTASLTPLEVAQTPGAAANVAKALQTLPGPQAVDEGSGLFVRGGDVTETRVLLDDAWLLSPARFDNPLGHSTATVNPFLLDRTVFSAGGFGAQYGNALSGLVRMETAGRPAKSSGSTTLSVGSAGISAALAPHARIGVRATANVRSLSPLVTIFGEAQPYDPPPRGGDVSGTLEWQSSRAGRVRLFGLRDRSRLGVGNAGVQSGTTYAISTGQEMLVLSWRESTTALRPAITVARSSVDRRESVSQTRFGTRLGATHVVGALGWRSDGGLELRMGGDLERLDAHYDGVVDSGAGTPSRRLFMADVRTDRTGAFLEAIARNAHGLRIAGGVRTDRATITGVRTTDPRLSLAWQRGSLGLTAAWGILHQVAEPTFYRPTASGRSFAPMRVRESIVGVQWGGDSTGLRVEFYDKLYANLWQFTRSFDVAGGGAGRARGADLFLRARLGESMRSRVAWSIVRSRRDDPDTGVDAPAIGDVRHSVSWITERTFGRLTVNTALRHATGRPFTDITGVTARDGFATPVFGDPFAERLPAYWRSDISASWYRPIGGGRAMVLWGDLSNVFDRGNVMRYRWSADYRERLPVRAPFNRALYVGATLLY